MLELLTAKQMKEHFKALKKQKAEEEKIRLENQTVKEEVIAYWLEQLKESDNGYIAQITLYGEMDEELSPMEIEINKNFQAYQKAFGKMGYRLKQVYDGECCGWLLAV